MRSRESWPQEPIIEDKYSAYREEILRLQGLLRETEEALKTNREERERAGEKFKRLEEKPENETNKNELLEVVVALQKRINELEKTRNDIVGRIYLLGEEDYFSAQALLEHEERREN